MSMMGLGFQAPRIRPGRAGKVPVSIWDLLVWAFQSERVSLDFDEMGRQGEREREEEEARGEWTHPHPPSPPPPLWLAHPLPRFASEAAAGDECVECVRQGRRCRCWLALALHPAAWRALSCAARVSVWPCAP